MTGHEDLDISITVVGAEYPVNLGYTARLMKNFGLRRLYLVDPNCDMRAASVYASHGSEVLAQAEVVTLGEVRKSHDFLLGTTAIRARRGANVSRTTLRPEDAVARMVAAKSASMVFGRDTTGLTNKELTLCDLVTTIDTRTDYKTLNVSHSVGILLYLTSRAADGAAGRLKGEGSNASRERREAFSRYAYQLAIASGMQEHRAGRMVQVARRVASKSDVNSRELGLMVSLMRKAALAIEKGRD
ncbi:MAG TPA: TrmH family RNA methyltransferase [Nitrososphaerales archaeon]|nr:TrmH family RNA methyltransferase [Nitrososphaerales archaeon]